MVSHVGVKKVKVKIRILCFSSVSHWVMNHEMPHQKSYKNKGLLTFSKFRYLCFEDIMQLSTIRKHSYQKIFLFVCLLFEIIIYITVRQFFIWGMLFHGASPQAYEKKEQSTIRKLCTVGGPLKVSLWDNGVRNQEELLRAFCVSRTCTSINTAVV